MGSYYSGMMNNVCGYGYLKHHGILGQKWGVRRFQNPDGTLTEAGKERYYGNGSYVGYEAEAKKISETFSKKVGKLDRSSEQFAEKYSKAEKDFDADDAVVLNKYLKILDDGVKKTNELYNKSYNFLENGTKNEFVRNETLKFAKEITGAYADRSATLTDGSEGTVAERLTDDIIRESVKQKWDELHGDGSYQKIITDTDYKYSPYYKHDNKDSKWDFERELLSYDDLSVEEFDKLPKSEVDRYVTLQKRMEMESGSYYFNTPVTTAFAKANEKIKQEQTKKELMIEKAEKSAKAPYTKREKELHARYMQSRLPSDEVKWFDVYEEMHDAMNRAEDKVRKSEAYKNSEKNIEKYEDELVGVVLRDIGYTDSPEARKMAYYMVFWD